MKVVAFKLLALAFPIPLVTVSHFTVYTLIIVFLMLTVVTEVKSEFRKKCFCHQSFLCFVIFLWFPCTILNALTYEITNP